MQMFSCEAGVTPFAQVTKASFGENCTTLCLIFLILICWGDDLLLFLSSSVMNFAFSQRSGVLSRTAVTVCHFQSLPTSKWTLLVFLWSPCALVRHSDRLLWSPE